MDLLSDDSFEALLKLCARGAVAYGAASPSCAQYSRLKPRGDSGPPPLRAPEFLQGAPGIRANDLAKVQESFTMLSRCLTCLSVIHSAGGHVHLEQPSTAMSWLELKNPVIHQINWYVLHEPCCLPIRPKLAQELDVCQQLSNSEAVRLYLPAPSGISRAGRRPYQPSR